MIQKLRPYLAPLGLIVGLLVGIGAAMIDTMPAKDPPVGDPVYAVDTFSPSLEIAPEAREYCLAHGYDERIVEASAVQEQCLVEYWTAGDRLAHHGGDEVAKMSPAEQRAWILSDPLRTTDPSHSVRYD